MKTDVELIGLLKPELLDRSTLSTWSKKSKLLTVFNRVWCALATGLMGRSEPTIQQIRDRSGLVIWQVYDPATAQSFSFSSEQEVRVWLDQRYYL